MSDKRKFIKTAIFAAVPAMFSTRLLATTPDDSNQNKVLALIWAAIEKLKKTADLVGNPGLYHPGHAPGSRGPHAGPGCIGESIEGGLNGQISLTSGQPYNAATLSLSPGLWQIHVGASVGMGAGCRVMDWLVEISLAPNTWDSPTRRGRLGAGLADVDLIAPISSFVQLTQPTRFYLNTRAYFTAGNATWNPGSSYFYAIRVG